MNTVANTSAKKPLSKTDIIRAELKAAGIKRNDVSVRCDYNSIRCEIKSIDVDFATVKKAAYKHQSISRCEYSGEILCGGNTYVNVCYSDVVVDEVVKKLLPLLGDVATKGFDWQGFSVSYDDVYKRYSVWGDCGKGYREHVSIGFTAHEIACVVAKTALETGKAKF